jgi:hypothetical protein
VGGDVHILAQGVHCGSSARNGWSVDKPRPYFSFSDRSSFCREFPLSELSQPAPNEVGPVQLRFVPRCSQVCLLRWDVPFSPLLVGTPATVGVSTVVGMPTVTVPVRESVQEKGIA